MHGWMDGWMICRVLAFPVLYIFMHGFIYFYFFHYDGKLCKYIWNDVQCNMEMLATT